MPSISVFIDLPLLLANMLPVKVLRKISHLNIKLCSQNQSIEEIKHLCLQEIFKMYPDTIDLIGISDLYIVDRSKNN